MPMVQVRVVRMAVDQRCMPMLMGMRLAGRFRSVVSVLVMLVVTVAVLVLDRLVAMLMVMSLREMKPQPEGHETPRNDQGGRYWLVQESYSQNRADERCEREISTGPGCAEIPKSEDEQGETDAVAEEADDPGGDGDFGRRQAGPAHQGDDEVHRTGDEALDHGDLDRIGGGELPRQIIVDAPA